MPWPGGIEVLDEAGSTNDELKERAKQGAPEWSVVLARRQTAGRGRHGRSWVCLEGNLFVSVLLRPTAFETLLPLVSGLAVVEALSLSFGVEARLKWPNDVLVGAAKLGGILAEGMSTGSALEAVVVGIGVNLSAAPAGATSIRAETGAAPDPEEAAAAILARLAVWYDRLRREGPRAIAGAWREASVPWWGKTVEVLSGDRLLRGTARDIDETGALILEGQDGAAHAVLSGEARPFRLE